jgi:hypothetical protein
VVEFLDKMTRKDILIRYAVVALYALLCGGVIISWDNCSVFQNKHVNHFFANIIGLTKPNWPTATIIITVFLSWVFYEPLVRLIDRIIKIYGVESPIQQSAKAETPADNYQYPHQSILNSALNLQDENVAIVKEWKDQIKQLTDTHYPNSTPEEKFEITVHHFVISLLNNSFNEIHRTIFFSQITLLKELKKVNSLPHSKVEKYFLNLQSQFPEEFGSLTKEDYLRYLLNSNLIKYDPFEGELILTSTGDYFLVWLDRNSHLPIRPL